MLAEAAILFWKKGYEGTTMRDIAEAYGCKPANIYNFFANKESLLFEILFSQMKALVSSIQHLEDDESGSPVEQLEEFVIHHASLTLRYTRSSKLLFDVGLGSLSPSKRKRIVKLRDAYDRILRKIIRRGIKTGDFADLDEKLAGYCIASTVLRSIIWYSPDGRLSMEGIIHFMVQFVLNGLKRQEGVSKNSRRLSQVARGTIS